MNSPVVYNSLPEGLTGVKISIVETEPQGLCNLIHFTVWN